METRVVKTRTLEFDLLSRPTTEDGNLGLMTLKHKGAEESTGGSTVAVTDDCDVAIV